MATEQFIELHIEVNREEHNSYFSDSKMKIEWHSQKSVEEWISFTYFSLKEMGFISSNGKIKYTSSY